MTKNFHLPDLGEGLPDATIIEWFVKEGDTIGLDDPLVSVETAKAVVEIPSPVSGIVRKLAGAAGEVIITGAVLAQFDPDPAQPQRAQGQDTGHHHADTTHHTGEPASAPPGHAVTGSDAIAAAPPRTHGDAGTVVGAMQHSNTVHHEQAITLGGIRAMPAVRALAKKLRVDLARVRASGPDDTVTLADVQQAAASHTASAVRDGAENRVPRSASGKPIRTQPPEMTIQGQPEQLKGVRRNMAQVMADAHAKVVPTTLTDDADLHAWSLGNDLTARLVRAIVRACQTVPALNAWFDGDALNRTLHAQVDIGIAIDTSEGLFVPVLRNADMLDGPSIREGVNRLRKHVQTRAITASELRGYTISLSNFGMFAGRYATPVVVPPCVAIIGAGRARHQLTAVMGGIETHRVLPLSLTFDHRAATGGEAARFLLAMLEDLALAN